MNDIKIKYWTLFLLAGFCTQSAYSQSLEELLARKRELNRIRFEVGARAQELLSEKKFEEARLEFLKNVYVSTELVRLGETPASDLICSQWSWVALCEEKLHHPDLAILAYRKSICWIPQGNGTFYLYGNDGLLANYALVLAQSNKLAQAKTVYYAALNRLKTTRTSQEPAPFLVVFDQDPEAEVWQPTKANFIKAIKAVQVLTTGNGAEGLAADYPDWPYAQQLKDANQNSGTPFTPENDPNIKRKNLQILIKAEKDLASNWQTICDPFPPTP